MRYSIFVSDGKLRRTLLDQRETLESAEKCHALVIKAIKFSKGTGNVYIDVLAKNGICSDRINMVVIRHGQIIIEDVNATTE
jgi:hypothetical protein